MKRGIIADYIRAHVKRPKKLPKPESHFRDNALRFSFRDVCPMGMLNEAIRSAPCEATHFKPLPKGFTDVRIDAFAAWWDALEDPLRAVDELWG